MTTAAKSLADGRQKFTICTTPPANPLAPTVTELNAGLDASPVILASDFAWSATGSDSVQERVLIDDTNAASYGASNWQASITLMRLFDTTTNQVDLTADAAYQAVKTKGTEFWGYLRENGKLATTAWASGDDAIGMRVVTDNPQRPQNDGGFIKRTIPLAVQEGHDDVAVVTGS